MASISANGARGHHKFTLTVTENSTSTANNTSSISYSFQLSAVQAGWNWSGWGSKISYTVTINGTNYTGTIPDYNGSSTVTLKSGSGISVGHNADGTKSINFNFSVSDGAGQSYTPGNASASGSMNLTTIPRASSPSVSSSPFTVNGSNQLTIYTNRASNSFTHTLIVKTGNTTLATFNNVGASQVWTVPTSVFNYQTGGTSMSYTVTCTTYNGSTNIGSKDVSGSFNADTNTFRPTFSNATCSETAVSGVTGWNVLNLLSAKNVGITIGLKNGATVKSITLNGAGMNWSSGTTYTKSLSGLTSATFTFAVTDSRGLTNSYTTTGTVYPYSYPTIESLIVRRVNQLSSDATLEVKGKYANTSSPKTNSVRYSVSGARTVAEKNASYSDGSWNGTESFSDLSTSGSYSFTVSITDAYGKTASKSYTLPISKPAIWVGNETVRIEDLVVNNRLAMYNGNNLVVLTGSQLNSLLQINNNWLLTRIYPVGSIYMSVNNVSPASFIGGTWERLQDRVLVGAGNSYAVNSTGGSNTRDIAAHTHGSDSTRNGTLKAAIGATDNDPARIGYIATSGSEVSSERSTYTVIGSSYTSKSNFNHYTEVRGTTASGGSTTVDVRQPYLAVYMWKRTA